MELPFSRQEFLEIFAAYNLALWPLAVLLWLISLGAVLAIVRRRNIHRLFTGLLALHWAWVAVAYHFFHFAQINPAAYFFAALFMVQALLFATLALGRRSPMYSLATTPRHIVGIALIGYSFVYPFLAMTIVDSYPGTPTYGVPCPTTLLTLGPVFIASPIPWWYLVIPVMWSVIGGSAALLLGVPLDYILLIAGGLLVFQVLGVGKGDRDKVHLG